MTITLRKMNVKILLSGAWPKSKAALFEFCEVCEGFTTINSHLAPGNGPLFYRGENNIFWPCASLLQGNSVQGAALSQEGSNSLVTWPELLEMGQPVWFCVTEPVLEAVCQLGRLACLCKLLDFRTNNKAVHEVS